MTEVLAVLGRLPARPAIAGWVEHISTQESIDWVFTCSTEAAVIQGNLSAGLSDVHRQFELFQRPAVSLSYVLTSSRDIGLRDKQSTKPDIQVLQEWEQYPGWNAFWAGKGQQRKMIDLRALGGWRGEGEGARTATSFKQRLRAGPEWIPAVISIWLIQFRFLMITTMMHFTDVVTR